MKKFLLSCFLLLFTYSYAVVAGDNQTTWNTGAYEDNTNLSKKLYITGASKIKVKIKGSTEEGYDFVYVYDQKGKLVRKLSGNIDEEFIVDGSLITAKLISDDATEDKGVSVSIQKANGASSNYTSWKVNNYDNNENIEKRLHIDGASKIKVKLSGKTEAGYDYLIIKDLNGNIIKELSGSFDETFVVDGSDIIAHFESDDATTDKGFSVDISNSDGTLPDVTTWVTGAYDNDDILTKDLRISKADRLKVKIQGSTEKDYDFVYIYDQNGELVKKLSGNIDQEFIVDGSLITAKLISDDSVTDSGVKVEISKVMNNIRYKLKLLSKKVLSEDENLFYYQISYSYKHGSHRTKMLPFATKVYTTNNKVFVQYNLVNPVTDTYSNPSDIKDSEPSFLTTDIHKLGDINTSTDLWKLTSATSNETESLCATTVTDNGNIISFLDGFEKMFYYDSRLYSSYVAYNINNGLKEIANLISTSEIDFTSNILYASDKYKLFFSEYISDRKQTADDYSNKNYLCRDMYKINKNSENNDYWLNQVSNNKNLYKIITKCTKKYKQSDFTKSVATFDNNFYRGTEDGRLIVYNLDTKSFYEQYSMDFGNTIEKIVISKDKKRLYLALGKKGIAILDISNPQVPTLISTFDTKGYAYDLAVSNSGQEIYVADGTNGVVAIDAYNQNKLKLIDHYKTDDKAVGIGITNDDSKVIVADMKDILVLQLYKWAVY